jgi:hypothetical protein
MVVPTGAVFVVGPIERFRPERFNRRIRDDPPYQSFDPAVAGRATLLCLADDTSKGWSKVRGCGSNIEVVVWVDVAIWNFVVGDRSGRGLGAKLADF